MLIVTVSVVEPAIQLPVILAIKEVVVDIEIGKLEPCPKTFPDRSDH